MKINTIIGIILIIIGCIFLGNNLDIWDLNIFFEGWWTIFILVPGFISLFKKEFKSGLITIAIGLLFFLGARDIISFSALGPVIIILIGITIIFSAFPKKEFIKNSDYLAIFSGNSAVINEEAKNISTTTIFGGVDLDFRNANFKKDITINAVCIFGGIDILVPKDVIVKVEGTPVFGAIENKSLGKEGKTITIKCMCIFGGIDIN